MPEIGTMKAAALWLAVVGTASCTGVIGASGGSTASAGSGGVGTGPGPIGAGGAGGNPRPECVVGTAPLRRLTQREYENTLRELKVLGPVQKLVYLIPDETRVGFETNSGDPINPDAVAQYHAAAHRLALEARLTDVLGCDPAQSGEDTCARTFIDAFGRRAYRRPLDQDERAALLAIYSAEKGRSTFDAAVKLVLQAILESPQLLYRAEGELAAGQPGVFPLSGPELASRLSYFLWASAPDDELLDAAAAGQLATREGIERQARRMLADPRFSNALASFTFQWLGLERLDDVAGSKKGRLLFNAAMRDASRNETLRFVDYVVREGGGSLETLFRARFSLIAPALNEVYGLSLKGAPDQPQRVDFPPPVDRQRVGLLTQVSLMSTLATNDQTSPIRRGVFVRRHLLCQELQPPPQKLVDMGKTLPPPRDAKLTTRERFEMHSGDPACSGCHKLIDPVGFGFEHYEWHGMYVDRENTTGNDAAAAPVWRDIDSTFDLMGTTFDGHYADAVAFAERLATSKDLRDCLVEQYFRFLLGRVIDKTAQDSCVFDGVSSAFAADGYRIPDLLAALVTSDAFRFMRVE